MKSGLLRNIRILFSTIILISFILVFADFSSLIPTDYHGLLLYLQFVPSVMKFFDLNSMVAAGFLIVILLTLLSGRTYCSFFCPLGIGQDLFSRIGGRFRKKFRRFGFQRPFTIVRYSILAIILIFTMTWGIYLVTLFDPFSIFGRFMTYFARPAILIINNGLAGIFGKFDNYTFSNMPVKGYSLVAYSVPVAFLILVGLLSFTRGRLYCNMICPVGTLLGLLSKISLFRIRHDQDACTRCGRCAVRCKGHCIDFLNNQVDVSRCVNCFNCLTTCQDKAISLGVVRLRVSEHKTNESRRSAVAVMLFFMTGIHSSLKAREKQVPVPKKRSSVKEKKSYPVCPPGGQGIADFNKDCIACSLCISACPNGVLQPAFLEYGLAGMMQPVMDYHKSFCTYNCVKCTEICPSNALHPLVPEAKKLTQIGKVIFIKDNCIVKTEKTACGACAESCPTKAVHMIPYEGNLVIPAVNTDICIGCGHCEYACPTTPFKAVFVDGNPVHVAAKKPEIIESDMKKLQDFPF
jgi:polyferredoxin